MTEPDIIRINGVEYEPLALCPYWTDECVRCNAEGRYLRVCLVEKVK